MKALLLSLACLATACGDPILGMRGTVRSAPSTCDAADGPVGVQAIITDAKVTLLCNDHVLLAAKTNARGVFRNGTAGMASPRCIVRVEKEGYATRELKLVDFCAGQDGTFHPVGGVGPCSARIAVELEPAKR